MNLKFLLIAFSAIAISSCSTAYKSGQTPDDVYFSPIRTVEEDSRKEDDREETKRYSYRDREIQMAIYDRRWRDFDDDYNRNYDPYRYGYSYGYYYNPYYCYYPVFISSVNVSNPKNTVPRMTNLGSYNNTTYTIYNTKTGSMISTGNRRQYNNSNNNVNNYIRKILTTPLPSNNTNDNNTRSSSDNSTRSYTPSSSGSSSSGSSSGSGAPVSRPGRGN